MKKKIVIQSISLRIISSTFFRLPINTKIKPAAIAIVAFSRCNGFWKINASNIKPTTPRVIHNSFGLVIKFLSLYSIILARRSLLTYIFPLYKSHINPKLPIITITMAGVKFRKKSIKVYFVALAIRILGGSPIIVDAPPILEAITIVIIKGAGVIFSSSAISKTIGTKIIIVVTLPKIAEITAVATNIIAIILSGLPLAIFAVLMAIYINIPVCRITDIVSIIPIRKNITFQSIAEKARV